MGAQSMPIQDVNQFGDNRWGQIGFQQRGNFISVALNCRVSLTVMRELKVWEEAWCRNGAIAIPFSFTYIGGFLLSQLKLLLGILKSLGVLVQLILSSLELLLQSYQVVLKLRASFSARTVSEVISVEHGGGAWARKGARAWTETHTHTHTHTHTRSGDRTGEDRTGEKREREQKKS